MNQYKFDTSIIAQRLGGGLPSIVKDILKNGGSWVAGGYILSKITGNPVKDIDIFFRDYSAYNYAKSLLTAEYNSIADIKEHEGTTTFKFPDGRPAIQVIGNWFSENACILLDKFDFTISQCALVHSGTYELITVKGFYQDVATRELRYNPNDESRGSSIMRVVKYAGKGYKISTEELSKVLEALYARAYLKDGFNQKEPVLSFLKQFRSPSGE